MIQSMTGFGKSSEQFPQGKISIEIKSLNSGKGADISMRIPQTFKEKEIELRRIITQRLQRGKIDFSLTVENSEKSSTSLNKSLIISYMQQLQELAPASPAELLQMALKMPEVLSPTQEEIDPEQFKQILSLTEKALEQLELFRIQEGKILEEDFKLRLRLIRDFLENIKKEDAPRLAQIRERLSRAVEEIRERTDANRFEQELIFYLEKLDITEEIVRLTNHLDYFEQTLNAPQSNGKKLGFICQEMGREINTIGSKANFAPMQHWVVQMKNELEKIKEQVANVL